MEDNQAKALRAILMRARELQALYPEVATLYREGNTCTQIKDYLVGEGVEGRCLDKVIGYIIRGHDGGLGVDSYEGLIPDEKEREEIAHTHHTENGESLTQNGLGIHGRPKDKRIIDARKAGQAAGRVVKERGLGFCGMTREKLAVVSQKGVQRRGDTSWEGSYSELTGKSEEDYLQDCATLRTYIIQSGPNKGRHDCKGLADVLNEHYHGKRKVRTPLAVNIRLGRLLPK
jgi:hypothetical protein